MKPIYASVELITGFMVGFELAEIDKISYVIIDLGIIRININWDLE